MPRPARERKRAAQVRCSELVCSYSTHALSLAAGWLQAKQLGAELEEAFAHLDLPDPCAVRGLMAVGKGGG